jgi:o-succinylbenzoate synthase
MMETLDCRIKELVVREYALPFKVPLRLGKKTLKTRRGLITALIDEEGLSGYGETAPLEGFSRETLSGAKAQLQRLAGKLPGMNLIHDFSLKCTDYGTMIPGFQPYPAVAFGVETAAVNLLQTRFRTVMPGTDAPRLVKKIPVNALLHLPEPGQSPDKAVGEILAGGFRTIKIKVGRHPLNAEIRQIRRVAELLPPGVRLRLDANGLWDYPAAVAFGKEISGIKALIEYIEEPFPVKDFLPLATFFRETGIPVALDETLQDRVPGEFPLPEGLAALVIKPTLLGGFQRIMELIDLAKQNGLKAIISSCFEAGPGFAELLKIAASSDGDRYASGLDTLRYLQQDLFAKPVQIRQGAISLKLPPEPFRLASGWLDRLPGDLG